IGTCPPRLTPPSHDRRSPTIESHWPPDCVLVYFLGRVCRAVLVLWDASHPADVPEPGAALCGHRPDLLHVQDGGLFPAALGRVSGGSVHRQVLGDCWLLGPLCSGTLYFGHRELHSAHHRAGP